MRKTVLADGSKGKDSAPMRKRCRLWQKIGQESEECAGRFYPHCGGSRRWYPCRPRYPLVIHKP